MSGFFSDNQTKQKAYDRYYNQVAKSNYVQGRKLKAMINQEGVDDASTDSLAALFQKAMMKSHDYEYDQITRKLMQRAPAVLSDSKQPKAKSAKATGGIPVNLKGKKTKTKYVPEMTDTDILMTPPRSASSEKNFEQKMSDEDQAPPKQRDAFINSVVEDELKYKNGVAKPVNFTTTDERIEAYLNKQKIRKSQRVAAARSIKKQIEKEINKRQRDNPVNFISPNPRPKKTSRFISPMKKPLAEKLNEPIIAHDNEEYDDEFNRGVEEEERIQKLNPGIRKYYTKLFREMKAKNDYNQESVYGSILTKFETAVNMRKGEDYFKSNAPKPNNGESFPQYKKELRGWLNGVFI